jgi:hypothetical protein
VTDKQLEASVTRHLQSSLIDAGSLLLHVQHLQAGGDAGDLSAADFVTRHMSRNARHRSQVTGHRSQVTGHLHKALKNDVLPMPFLPMRPYFPPAKHHVTRHTLHVTPPMNLHQVDGKPLFRFNFYYCNSSPIVMLSVASATSSLPPA